MRTITVTGQGAARVVPDVAVVRVAAAHQAATLREALDGASSAADLVVEVARRFTEQRRIGTTNLNAWPTHDYEGRLAGFEARHALVVTCPDLGQAGELVAALASEVGDRLQVESVALGVDDPADAQTAAREAAYADARGRAAHLAALAGAELGEVQSVAEDGAVPSAGPATRFLAAQAEVSFEPGESEVRASLTVTFQLA